jgi:hypothetical protein
MEIVTRIGAVAFRLKGAAKATLPRLESKPLPLPSGEFLVASTDDGAITYVIVDHRSEPGTAPASVEFWEPVGVCEGGLAGLFALCDPAEQAAAATPVGSLEALRALCTTARFLDGGLSGAGPQVGVALGL